MSLLDANVLVRYLIEDPPELAERAAQIIDNETLSINSVALAETYWVLTSFYQLKRELVIEYLTAFLQKQNISVFGLEKSLVLQGFEMCKPSKRVSVEDALIWADAHSDVDKTVYTFDERFPENGITVKR